jgi:beta-phosphoglucomutase-like phosphatase (HAD superfamily)
MIKAILFDLDGVLVNMPDGHYEALNRTLNLFGARINEEEHQKQFNGLPTKKKLEELERQGRLTPGLRDFIAQLKQKYTKELIPKFCTPDYSKIILLKFLKNKGYKVACCSNSIRESIDSMLTHAQIIDHFDLIIGNDEITNPKPDPEIFIKAFNFLGVEPCECIIVEDSAPGVQAAHQSGARVYEVKNPDDVNLSLFKNLFEQEAEQKSSIYRLENFTKGWIVGDFQPSLLQTKEFEFAVKKYSTGDKEDKHVHKAANEFTVIVTGVFKMNGDTVRQGDVIWKKPGEPSDFECIEDGFVAVTKTPSVKGDKYLLKDEI